MEAYRLSREQYATGLSGIGAAKKGACWNSVGTEIIYTASNRSLAMAEVAVHLSLATLPDDYVMITLYIPDDIALARINVADLPVDWNRFPHPTTTQHVGDRFISENKYCIMQTPSAVTEGDYNLLINPYHADFKQISVISVKKFVFDQRLFQ